MNHFFCSNSFYILNVILFISVLKINLDGLLWFVHLRVSSLQELWLSTGALALVFSHSACGAVTSSQIRTILPFSPAALIFFLLPVHEFVILYNSL